MKLSYIVFLSTLTAAVAAPIKTTASLPAVPAVPAKTVKGVATAAVPAVPAVPLAALKAKSVKGAALPGVPAKIKSIKGVATPAIPAIPSNGKVKSIKGVTGKPVTPVTPPLPPAPIVNPLGTTPIVETRSAPVTNPLAASVVANPLALLNATKTSTATTLPAGIKATTTTVNPLLGLASLNSTRTNGGAGGDPHFRTYDGTMYSYHGQCDLIMAHSSTFGNGLGIDVHARTEIVTGWSLISNAAIRIGNDIFEVVNDGSIYLNGQSNLELPLTMANKYQVSLTEELIEHKTQSGALIKSKRSFFRIKLDNGEFILLTLFRKMLSVRVNAELNNTSGMLGIHGMEGMIGRDMVTQIEDPNVMGAEWQVTNVEPMLFHEIRAPQYPESCQLPVVQSRRRLRVSDALMKQAELACSNVEKNMYDFCINDVLLTGDSELADGYGNAW